MHIYAALAGDLPFPQMSRQSYNQSCAGTHVGYIEQVYTGGCIVQCYPVYLSAQDLVQNLDKVSDFLLFTRYQHKSLQKDKKLKTHQYCNAPD